MRTTRNNAVYRTAGAARQASRSRSRAFSLVEVLLAIFILGIGLIMVATVFPVGAEWTRQTAEDSLSQTISQNALTVIRTHYAQNPFRGFLTPANMGASVSGSPYEVQALPGFTQIPVTERAYQFGSNSPFPAANPAGCSYFWTALIRLNPINPRDAAGNALPSPTYTYDLYILVFRKGDSRQVFTNTGGATEMAFTRDASNNNFREELIPSVVFGPYQSGDYNASRTPTVKGAVPPVGGIGIGVNSGTVFKQTVDVIAGSALPRPFPMANEQIIYSPPADGTTASPLIYVFQTILTQ